MTARSLRRLLERARARIERGWCRDALTRDRRGGFGPACAAVAWSANGALWADLRTSFETVIAAVDLLLVVSADLAPRRAWNDLCAWNDAPGRTQADVLQLYDAAISAARSDEAMEATR